MHYFIDGYNLMFRVIRAGDDLQAQREHIINDLNRKIQTLGLDVTLVFDAQYQLQESSRSHIQHLEILFTNHGETADEWILQELKRCKDPQLQTVVTSDKKLAWLARRRNAKTEPVEDFLKWLNTRYRNKLKRSKHPIIKEQIIPKSRPTKKDFIPTSESSTEECHDYYLQQFEEEYKQIEAAKPIKKTEKPAPEKKSKKISKKKMEDDGLTTMERWLKAFERNLDEDYQDKDKQHD